METVTIPGRNGVGKSTALRSIVGLIKRRTGRIAMNGSDLMAMAVHGIAVTGIGLVPEERGIFASLSVDENLYLPPAVSKDAIPVEKIHEMFPNLAERREATGGQLSGGVRQMLAMARVLRPGADLLLLHEPTEGLAPVIVERIGELNTQLKGMGTRSCWWRRASTLPERSWPVAHRQLCPRGALHAGAMFAYLGQPWFGSGYWPALLLAPLLEGIFGMILQRMLISRIAELDHICGLLLIFGLMLGIEGTMQSWHVIQRSRLGACLRASTETPALVQVFGVNVPLLITLTFGAASALAGLAGVLAVPVFKASPVMGRIS